MSIRHILLAGILACCSPFVDAQKQPVKVTDKATMRWGADRNVKVDGGLGTVIGEHDDAVLFRSWLKSDLWLNRMGHDLRVAGRTAVPMKMGKTDHFMEGVWLVDDKVHVVTYTFDKSKAVTEFYVRTYDALSLGGSGIRKLHTIKEINKKKRADTDVRFRPGIGFIMHITHAIEDKKDVRETEELFFDEDFEPSTDAHARRRMPFPADEFSVIASVQDQDGSTVMIGRHYPDKATRKANTREGRPVYTPYLVYFPEGAEMGEAVKLELENKFIQDIRMRIPSDPAGPIIVAGLYGDRGSWSAKGAFLMKLDRRTKQVESHNFLAFERDFIRAYMTEKAAAKADKKAERANVEPELNHLDLDFIMLREDGGVTFVAEQYHSYQVCYTDSKGNTRCYMMYDYSDIVVVSADSDGQLEWAQRIPKRQLSSDGGYYSSYAFMNMGNELHFIHNDNVENREVKRNEGVEIFRVIGKKAMITIATVDAEGRLERKALMQVEKDQPALRPKACMQISEKQMLIYAVYKKKSRFGLVTFE